MPQRQADLLAVNRGLVVAPAGCGKTQLLADTLRSYTGVKPILLLTHTNAGVAALLGRLREARVASRAYRVSTIDGWAIRLVRNFPNRAACPPVVFGSDRPDYVAIREAAGRLLKAGHISDALAASYSRLLVDEYQDCSIRQHAMVYYASLVLPTCVVGDPLQAIFGFGSDRLAGWEKHVRAHFPLVAELSQPWRWINAGTPALGKWLLECRVALLAGRSIDLTKAPSEVLWVQLDGSNSDYEKRLRVCLTSAPDSQGSVVIIGDSRSPDSQRRVASQTPGAVTIEAVDLKDLVTFAREFDVEASDALTRLLEFAENVMTNAGVRALETRLASIKGRRARTPPTAVERTALAFEGDRTQMRAAELLVEINKQPGVRAHRPEILRACLRGLDTSGGSTGVSFGDAVVRIREQKRYLGRALPRRAVGSTLLLKGLEAATVVVLDADGLDASNLYVALTRGSQRLVICSRSHLLQPA